MSCIVLLVIEITYFRDALHLIDLTQYIIRSSWRKKTTCIALDRYMVNIF